jgi:ribosome-associated translation inhibitor RaiA
VVTTGGAEPDLDLRVRVLGPVGEAQVQRAVGKLRAIARTAPRPVLSARLDLEVRADPALERPAEARATLDVSGRPVRAHVARRAMDEAVDQLVDRLQRNLRRLAERRERAEHRPGVARPGEWRHGALPPARPEHFPRPPEERQLIRHKSFAVDRITPEEAAFEMEMLDHDFHLFTDAATGVDCVIYRRPDGWLAMRSPDPEAGRGPAGEPAELPVEPVPEMPLEQALALLNVSNAPFVAFLDAGRRRVHVAYVRYDGHYGLLIPSAERDATPRAGLSAPPG